MKSGKYCILGIVLKFELKMIISVLTLACTPADRVYSINNWYFCNSKTYITISHRRCSEILTLYKHIIFIFLYFWSWDSISLSYFDPQTINGKAFRRTTLFYLPNTNACHWNLLNQKFVKLENWIKAVVQNCIWLWPYQSG